MKFLIIIPAHNEEKNIGFALGSLKQQSFGDFRVVVVNDGSEDRTPQIAAEFANQDRRFSVKNLGKSGHEPGAKVVRTFNKGLDGEDLTAFQVICKFDADIIFPQDYLEKVAQVYRENPKAGMVSGLVRIRKTVFEKALAYDFADEKKQWIFENLSSKNHVRGPIKSYRRECFEQMNGLRPVLGWDNIDVMLARMHGWEVLTIKNIWVKHLRPTAFKYKSQKAEKLGEYFYNIGLSLPLALISSAKSSWKSKSPGEFFVTMRTFLKQNSARELSREEINYIRKLRWQQMFGKK
ncbi:glycosyltransferase family 2 protein [Chryseobacterium sp. MFBS3-17]|uniref:glycosyltransferase family 2 protein n=1 Tax=Chryseobacterium sp. MFBS3-17 TaxID=2886689 RepID=UPI001D0E865A|nr:glycosyltransferase family 2 protein [Chryseobacterium sp. MFBS3-17]MCC2591008.1 glycosyltransferase family 2 protein [Chryseobacterium sp. MFBS3-17]